MPSTQKANTIEMGMEMQAGTERIHQDMEGKACHPWLSTTAILGLQFDVRTDCTIIYDPHLAADSRDIRPGTQELRHRKRVPGKQTEREYLGAITSWSLRTLESTGGQTACECLRVKASPSLLVEDSQRTS